VKFSHPRRTFWTIFSGVLICDQVTKFAVRASMAPGESRPLVPGLFDLTYVRNMGAAFGIFPGRQPVFALTSAVVLLVLWAYWRRSRPDSVPLVVAISLIASGALGNLIDRVWLGRVTDFLATTFMDFPVFNVADSAISVGTVILILWLLLTPDPSLAGRDADGERVETDAGSAE